ncbi:MAG: molybdenum cofactor guanylyltransferase [Chloroflexi bacterium]|nr:molybdenum cofactor guanylyltransferase [Chloroflexota bacterium]
MPGHPEITGIVLAGGAGRRMWTQPRGMGAPKPLLPLGGRTLIEHVIAAIEPLVSGVIVVTNDAESMAFLGHPTVADAEPGRGPLMGLYSGLLVCPTPYALAVPCDAPFLAPALLDALIARRRPDALTLPETEHGPQPMPGVYPTTLAPSIAALLEGGRAAMRDLVAAGPVELLTVAEVEALDPDGSSFLDMDTPEDLAAAQAELDERS